MKLLLLCTLLIASTSVFADSFFQAKTEKAISQAYDNRNYAPIEEAAEKSRGYTQALALYWLSQKDYSVKNMTQAQQKLDQAEAILKDRDDAESKVLLAAVYGMMMGVNPQLGGQLYPTTMALLESAEMDKSARPRALMVKGVNVFHTPPVYGGGAEKAVAVLTEAKAAYEEQRQKSIKTQAHWGESQTDWWLAKAKATVAGETTSL